MSAMLYLVPTPIGNLSDISERCREVLAQADFIAAEDTRVTLRLLNHLELKKPLVSYYEHNKAASGPRIVERILAGETCALVSDAGSPAISDPGEDLVRLCAEAGGAQQCNSQRNLYERRSDLYCYICGRWRDRQDYDRGRRLYTERLRLPDCSIQDWL